MGATAATASAAVPGWQLVNSPSESSSLLYKLNSTSCPSGKEALGAGGSIGGGAGQVGMTRMLSGGGPPAGGSLVSYEDDDGGFSGTWSQTAWAVCAYPLSGLQRVTAHSAFSSTAVKASSVSCPAGKRVVGAGFDHTAIIDPQFMGVFVLDDLRISESLTSVTATSREAPGQGGVLGSWRLAVQAVCAFPPPGLQFVSNLSARDSVSPKNATAVCPVGKRVLGVGGEITGGRGEVRFETLRPYAFFGQGALVNAIEDQDGATAAWDLRAYAICATA